MFAKILVTSFNVELVFTQTDNNKIIINVFKFQMIPKKRKLFFKEIVPGFQSSTSNCQNTQTEISFIVQMMTWSKHSFAKN